MAKQWTAAQRRKFLATHAAKKAAKQQELFEQRPGIGKSQEISLDAIPDKEPKKNKKQRVRPTIEALKHELAIELLRFLNRMFS